MLSRQPRATQAAHTAARLLSTTSPACARAGKTPTKGGKPSAPAPARRSKASAPTPPRRNPAPYVELLSRAQQFQGHPAYKQLVHDLTRSAERELGRPLSPKENPAAAALQADPPSKMVFERDPNNPQEPSPVARELLKNLQAARDTLNPDVLAGLSGDDAEHLKSRIEIRDETRRQVAEEDAELERLWRQEIGLVEQKPKVLTPEEEEEELDELIDQVDQRAEIRSPFLEGAAAKHFDPFELSQIEADPDGLSPVAFRMISIQRQFLHYMRLIEGDMFMLQGLRKPYKYPSLAHPVVVRTINYGGEKHPVTRKRVITVPVGLLPLAGRAARHKIKVLAGPRWTLRPPADGGIGPFDDLAYGQHGYIKISVEDFPEPVQNLKFASDILQDLIQAANDHSDTMEDIPVDERHVAAFYKRKTGYDKFGHRPSIDDFPLDWIHAPKAERDEIQKAREDTEFRQMHDWMGVLNDIHQYVHDHEKDFKDRQNIAWDEWDVAREEAEERGDLEAAAKPFYFPPETNEARDRYLLARWGVHYVVKEAGIKILPEILEEYMQQQEGRSPPS